MTKDWHDLIRGLMLLGARASVGPPIRCESGTLYVMASPEEFSVEELDMLASLGFIPEPEDGLIFESNRFGSA